MTFKLIGARDQARLPREFGANPFSEIFHTQTKSHGVTATKTEPSAVHCEKLKLGLVAFGRVYVLKDAMTCLNIRMDFNKMLCNDQSWTTAELITLLDS